MLSPQWRIKGKVIAVEKFSCPLWAQKRTLEFAPLKPNEYQFGMIKESHDTRRTFKFGLSLAIVWFVTACSANNPIAVGPSSDINDATFAARACGIIELNNDPLDPENSMLLIADKNLESSISCIERWIDSNAPHIKLTDQRRKKLGL